MDRRCLPRGCEHARGGIAREKEKCLEQALRMIPIRALSLTSRGPSTPTHRVSNRAQRDVALT